MRSCGRTWEYLREEADRERQTTMLQAILEGVSTFGPIVFLMLSPVLIPVFTISIGALADRRKKPVKTGR
jgi:hypothetical protein